MLLWRAALIHVFISLSEGVHEDFRQRQSSSDWRLKAPGTQADLEQLCDEKQGLLFQTVSHRQGSSFSDLCRWFYIVLSCSGWTWVRNFEVWGLSDTFCCALKQISGNSIVFLQEVSVSFLTQLIMCDYKHACIKYHQKKKKFKYYKDTNT